MGTHHPRGNKCDVLIIGYGIAGVSAAIEAADRGARVLVLDRGHGGGASALSGRIVYADGGTRYQQAAGPTFEAPPSWAIPNGGVQSFSKRHGTQVPSHHVGLGWASVSRGGPL